MSEQLEKKLGIYIIDKRHFDFFGNVLTELSRLKTPFELVINDLRQEQHADVADHLDEEMIQIAQNLNFPFKRLSDVIRRSFKYELLLTTFTFKNRIRLSPPTAMEKHTRRFYMFLESILSNIRFSGFSKRIQAVLQDFNQKFLEYPEVAISHKIIQFPKGMDIKPEKYPDSLTINIIDHYFCHGPFDSQLVQEKTQKSTTIVGYPRYDNLTTSNTDYIEQLRSEFGITSQKPIISWLPTYIPKKKNDDLNMQRWIPQVKKLSNDYEIIVRPHPKRLERSAADITTLLEQQGFYVDIVVERDMGALYMASEFILCDYGGVVFSAIYNDRNIILLNHSGHKTDTISNDTGDVLRSKLPELFPEDAIENNHLILDTIQNQQLWKNQEQTRKEIKEFYFGKDTKGHGASIAADTLNKMIHKQIPV
jgi:hypothetical protein